MKMKNKRVLNKWTGGTVLAGISLISLSAFAQDAESLDNGGVGTPAPQDQEQSADKSARLPMKVSVSGSHQFDSDIDNSGGQSFSISRFGVSLGVPIRFHEDFLLGTTVRYGLDSYDFSGGGSSPWENINTFSAASILQFRSSANLSYYGGGFVKSSAESGADMGDSFTGGGLFGVSYKVSDTFTIGGGLAVVSQLEDDANILPILTARWQFADQWRLNLGLTDVATVGYGADVKWQISPEWDFAFGVQFHKSRFRIDGTGASKNGVGEERAATLFADATWHPSPKVDLTGFVGIAAGGQLRLEDSSGHKLDDSNYDSAAILGLKASFRF